MKATTDNRDEQAVFSARNGSVTFRIRLRCDYGHGSKWGEWHTLQMQRERYGKLLDKILADEEVKEFEVRYPGTP